MYVQTDDRSKKTRLEMARALLPLDCSIVGDEGNCESDSNSGGYGTRSLTPRLAG